METPPPDAASRPAPRWHLVLVSCLLGVFVVLSVVSLGRLGLTEDEEKHLRYGRGILAGSSDRFDDSKMPFSALNALPGKLADSLPDGPLRDVSREFATARLVTILFATGTLALVYRWARELYGPHAGLLALFLAAWDPNLIAHSMLVTTDAYAVGMILLTLYCFWKLLSRPGWGRAFLSAFVLGLSQLAKYTSVFLYPLLIVIALVYTSPRWLPELRRKDVRALRGHLPKAALYAFLFAGVSLLVVNAGFLFNRSFTPLGDFRFRSGLFQTIQEVLPARLPVPVPYPYAEGLDEVSYRERSGFGYGRLYLFGALRESGGFPGYYLVLTLFKMPIASQAAVLLALFLYLRGRRFERFRRDEQLLLVPALFFTVYFNFFFGAQIGIRFLLPVFPLLYVFCGRLVERWELVTTRQKAIGGVLAVYLVGSVLSYHPHYIPYRNELLWDRRLAYRVFADSNLDWGQARLDLEDYLAAHPAARFEPREPRAGLTIVSPNSLVGVSGRRDQFAWLRDHFEPKGTIGYSYLVFDVSAAELRRALGVPRTLPRGAGPPR